MHPSVKKKLQFQLVFYGGLFIYYDIIESWWIYKIGTMWVYSNDTQMIKSST